MTLKNKDTITVQTLINADLDNVWDCWTKPEHIINWNFATDDWCCPKAENHLKPNGTFLWRMEAIDGSIGFDFTGDYKKVIEKKLITYIMTDGRKVKIDFLKNGNKVTLIETFEVEEINSNELQRAGWQAILENFKKYVESKTP